MGNILSCAGAGPALGVAVASGDVAAAEQVSSSPVTAVAGPQLHLPTVDTPRHRRCCPYSCSCHRTITWAVSDRPAGLSSAVLADTARTPGGRVLSAKQAGQDVFCPGSRCAAGNLCSSLLELDHAPERASAVWLGAEKGNLALLKVVCVGAERAKGTQSLQTWLSTSDKGDSALTIACSYWVRRSYQLKGKTRHLSEASLEQQGQHQHQQWCADADADSDSAQGHCSASPCCSHVRPSACAQLAPSLDSTGAHLESCQPAYLSQPSPMPWPGVAALSQSHATAMRKGPVSAARWSTAAAHCMAYLPVKAADGTRASSGPRP